MTGARTSRAGTATVPLAGRYRLVSPIAAGAASVFAWYSIGLLAGMAAFFAVFGRLNGLQRLAAVLSVRAEAPGPGRHVSEQEPDPAAGQPTVAEGS